VHERATVISPPPPPTDGTRAQVQRKAASPTRVIIAGGGTGGHIFCALAIAEGLERGLPDVELLLVGAKGGLEVQAAAGAGYPIQTVWMSGLERRLTPFKLARNLLLPLKLVVSKHQAHRILDDYRPDIVIGVGGYASGPLLAEAARLGISTVIHEANALPGLANRYLAKKASAICIGCPEAARYFPVGRSVLTGNPIRSVFTDAPLPSRSEARRRLGLDPEKTTLLVVGGSLGTDRLNTWVIDQQRRFAGEGLQVLWQCGRANHEACRGHLVDGLSVHLVPFLDDMAGAYAAADVVVAAAGAFTLAELAFFAKPAVIVPDREVSEDHQARNADLFEQKGAAICHTDRTNENLWAKVTTLVRDPELMKALGTQIFKLARPDAVGLIVAEVVKLRAGRTLPVKR
jgi:UDP-N-acetylglucosamine--N-acetylmuramyl-(pentapeptide) pyrophosphoryl-undecaprenol N-acetylglucosamine transferase